MPSPVLRTHSSESRKKDHKISVSVIKNSLFHQALSRQPQPRTQHTNSDPTYPHVETRRSSEVRSQTQPASLRTVTRPPGDKPIRHNGHNGRRAIGTYSTSSNSSSPRTTKTVSQSFIEHGHMRQQVHHQHQQLQNAPAKE